MGLYCRKVSGSGESSRGQSFFPAAFPNELRSLLANFFGVLAIVSSSSRAQLHSSTFSSKWGSASLLQWDTEGFFLFFVCLNHEREWFKTNSYRFFISMWLKKTTIHFREYQKIYIGALRFWIQINNKKLCSTIEHICFRIYVIHRTPKHRKLPSLSWPPNLIN